MKTLLWLPVVVTWCGSAKGEIKLFDGYRRCRCLLDAHLHGTAAFTASDRRVEHKRSRISGARIPDQTRSHRCASTADPGQVTHIPVSLRSPCSMLNSGSPVDDFVFARWVCHTFVAERPPRDITSGANCELPLSDITWDEHWTPYDQP